MSGGWGVLRTVEAYRDEVVARTGADLADRLAGVKLLAMDCDGILTSGLILYGAQGELAKDFHARDGLGLMMLRAAGIRRAVLTGRRSAMVERRCRDLQFEAIQMARFDKEAALREIFAATGCEAAATLYMGDDLLDLPAMALAGVAVTVPEASNEVHAAADLVTRAPGGRGAVREVCDLLLKSRGAFAAAIRDLAAAGPPAGSQEKP